MRCQNRGRSFSRTDCDAFNEFHFRRLTRSRGQDVAPKVGEEPLTLEEARFTRGNCSPWPRARTAPNCQERRVQHPGGPATDDSPLEAQGLERSGSRQDAAAPGKRIEQPSQGAARLAETWRQQVRCPSTVSKTTNSVPAGGAREADGGVPSQRGQVALRSRTAAAHARAGDRPEVYPGALRSSLRCGEPVSDATLRRRLP